MSKAHFAEMEILIKLGTQKESIILLTKFAEKLPLIRSYSLMDSGYFYNWVSTERPGLPAKEEQGFVQGACSSHEVMAHLFGLSKLR